MVANRLNKSIISWNGGGAFLFSVMVSAACVVGVAQAATTIDTTVSGQMTVTVPGSETYDFSSADVTALGARRLIKQGTGTLTLGCDLADASGEITIEAGTVVATKAKALGTANVTGQMTINAGATLQLNGGATFQWNARPIENNGTIEVCEARLRFWHFSPCTGTGRVLMTGSSSGKYNAIAFNSHAGGVPWELVWNGGTTGGSAFEVSSAAKDGRTKENTWTGPVTLASDFIIWSSGHQTLTIEGKVSGSGDFDNRQGLLRLTNPENDFTGIVKHTYKEKDIGFAADYPAAFAAGRYSFKERAVLTGSDGFSHPYGLLGIPAAATYGENALWTESAGHAVIESECPGACLMTFDGECATNDWNFSNQWLIHGGPGGTLVFTGELQSDASHILNWGGTLQFDSGTKRAGYTLLNDGAIRIAGTARFQAATNIFLGGNYPRLPRLVVADSAVLEAVPRAAQTPSVIYLALNSFNVQKEFRNFYDGLAYVNGKYVRGLVDIRDDAVVTNKFDLRCFGFNHAAGALYMRGRHVYNANDVSTYWAQDGCGYLGIEKGVFENGGLGPFTFGQGCGSASTIVMTDGAFVMNTNTVLYMSLAGGEASFYMSGGSLRGFSDLQINLFNASGGKSVSNGDCNSFTVAGGRAEFGNAICFWGCTNAVSILNVNGGTLSAQNFYRAIVHNWVAPGTHVYINFDGGVLALHGTQPFQGIDATADRLTVYKGGAILSSGANQTIARSFCAPSGKGVASVPIPAAARKAWNYIGAPLLKISGDGYGASAVALFDHDNGIVTNVVVTSPGCDYTYANVTWSYAGYTNRETVVATLAANAGPGGFVKRGTGTLTLSAVNAFGSPLRLEGGVLRCNADGAIPSGLDLVFDGGALDMNGRDYAAASVDAVSGSVSVGALTVGELKLDAAVRNQSSGSALAVSGTVVFAPGAKLTVRNPDGLKGASGARSFDLLSATGGITGTVPQIQNADGSPVSAWSCLISPDGTKLRMRPANGTMICIR